MDKKLLVDYIAQGLSIRQISKREGKSVATVRWALKKHSLKTQHSPPAKISDGTVCKCKHCGREYEYSRAKGHNLSTCNSCKSQHFRQRVKKQAVEYMGGACQRCGYDKYSGALHFHHLDPSKKGFKIGGGNKSFEFIKPELDKCELLCANCHAEAHKEI
jgi:hypothetical protein